jgi:hypothetical protein
MFPLGGPGLGLLLLRFSVAAILLMLGCNSLAAFHSYFLCAGAWLVSIFIAVGLLTPFFSMVTGAAAIAGLIFGHGPDTVTLVSLILNSAALALLGPGGYSLDGRWFGRRVVVVPPRKDIDTL